VSRVLIVSKTRMRGAHVCVGGHDLDNDMRSLRLMQPDGTNMPSDTRFDIGQVWELDYRPSPHIRKPHVEDVMVGQRGARQIDTVSPLGPFLRSRVTTWKGVPFEGTLMRTGSGAGYVASEGPFPSCSTGYWLPEPALVFDGDGRYVFYVDGGRRRIRYVGVADPADRIEIGTLVRVSLARPWSPPNAPEGLYLQISGCYEDK
jgi:hypothetical protein